MPGPAHLTLQRSSAGIEQSLKPARVLAFVVLLEFSLDLLNPLAALGSRKIRWSMSANYLFCSFFNPIDIRIWAFTSLPPFTTDVAKLCFAPTSVKSHD